MLYKAILTIRLQMIANFLKELGFMISMVLIVLTMGLLLLLAKLPAGYLTMALACVLCCIHFARKDKTMIETLSKRMYRKVLRVDYTLTAAPFFMEAVLLGHVKDMAGCMLTPLVFMYLPSFQFHLRIPTHPLLLKGSLFYAGNMRLLLVPYIICLLCAAMGWLYANRNLMIVSTMVFVFLLGGLQFMKARLPHVLFYKDFHHMVLLNGRLAFMNALMLLIPFGILYFAAAPNGLRLREIWVGWAACALFWLHTYLLRFSTSSLTIIHEFIFMALFILCCAAIISNYMVVGQLIIAILLIFIARKQTHSIFKRTI